MGSSEELLRIYWELDWNSLRTRKIQHPDPPPHKEKKMMDYLLS